MNSLLINLTRLGDLLQMQPVLHGLHDHGHKTGMLCLENFAPAVRMLEDLDHASVMPGSGLLSDLDRDWKAGLMRLDSFVREHHKAFPADQIFNFTATVAARLLARRVSLEGGGKSDILGFGLDPHGFGISGDGWATFLQGSTLKRANCPFNLVDMFRKCAGVADAPGRNNLRRPGAADLDKAAGELEQRTGPCAGYIGFQLGASDSRRQWPVENFAELGRLLYEELGLCAVLFGSPAERPLAEEYSRLASKAPHADMIGATDLPGLAALLCRTRLLITNDTGTMHLSAGLGRHVLAIFLATAQPFDTGPYMDGCCCLEPDLPCHPCAFDYKCDFGGICRRHIGVRTVFDLAAYWLKNGQWRVSSPVEARVWLSGRDECGFMDLTCLSGHEREDRSLWLAIQRIFYRHILDRINGTNSLEPSPEARLAQALSPSFRSETAELLRRAEDLLLLMLQQGKMLVLKPSQAGGLKLMASSNRLHELLAGYPPLCALGFLWQTLVQEKGGNLDMLLELAAGLRSDLALWRGFMDNGVTS